MQSSPISARPGELVEVFFLGTLVETCLPQGLKEVASGVRGWGIVLRSIVSVWPTQPREENVKHAAFLDGLLHHQPVLVQFLGSRQVGACGGNLI